MTGHDLSVRSGAIVLFATHSASGGVRELWQNLADGLRAQGHAVRLVAMYESPHDPGELPPLGWEHIVDRRPGGPVGALRLVRALARWLRTERPRAIISALPAANVMVSICARLASPGTDVFITHHSPVGTHHPVINWLDGQVGRLGNVRAVVGVSDAVTRSLAGKPGRYRSKRTTIRNALPPDLAAFLDGLGPRVGPRRAIGRKLVATGRLAAQKNYPMLLRALALLPDVDLDIVGSGPDEADLKALTAKLRLYDRVRFLGRKPREEAMTLLAAGDLFVQVSLFEGHSLALLEAAALSLPLIVSDVPVQVEAVTARDGTLCATLVDLGDEAALAAAIRAILDEPATYRDWSARARRLAAEATFGAMVARYEALLAARGPGRAVDVDPPRATT